MKPQKDDETTMDSQQFVKLVQDLAPAVGALAAPLVPVLVSQLRRRRPRPIARKQHRGCGRPSRRSVFREALQEPTTVRTAA